MTGAAAKACSKSPTRYRGRRLPRRCPAASGAVFRASVRSKRPVGARVVDADQCGGGARLLEGLGHHHRDRLVIMLDLRAAEQLGSVELALAELARVLGGHDGEHARRGFAWREVNRLMRPLAIAAPTM